MITCIRAKSLETYCIIVPRGCSPAGLQPRGRKSERLRDRLSHRLSVASGHQHDNRIADAVGTSDRYCPGHGTENLFVRYLYGLRPRCRPFLLRCGGRSTLYIPVRRYMHLGVANLEGCENVSLEDDNLCNRSHLHQQVADTLSSHRKGIFTARLPMDVKEGVDQHFDVRLYMVNCASALVLDTLGSHIKDIKVYTAGFATDFDIADSTYRYQYTPVFRTDKLDLSDVTSSKLCFVSVTFPSKTATDTDADTKIVIDTDDPFVTDDADQTLWQFRVYATLRDNTVTETLLSLKKPVLPGQLRCLTASVYENGTVSPADPTVGVSVTLDWDPGLEVDVEI